MLPLECQVLREDRLYLAFAQMCQVFWHRHRKVPFLH